jgi:hypothetical protein
LDAVIQSARGGFFFLVLETIMVVADSNISRSSVAADLGVVISFLIGGLLSGFVFAWLTKRPSLQRFWFLKGDKFLSPRYTYWIAFSFILLLGLAAAYAVARSREWLLCKPIGSSARLLATSVIIGASTPFLYFITPMMNRRIGLNWDFIAAPIALLILFSFALCVLTGSLRLLPLALVWNLIFTGSGFVFVYVAVRLISGASEWSELVQWPIFESMISLSFGSWLIWRQRIALNEPPT